MPFQPCWKQRHKSGEAWCQCQKRSSISRYVTLERHQPTYIPRAGGTCLHILGNDRGHWLWCNVVQWLGNKRGLANWGRRHWQRQQRGSVLATRLLLNKKEGCTFTATLDLSAPMEGIIDEVWQAPVQVHWCQTTLKAIPGGHKLWEVAIHALGQTRHVQVTWKGKQVVKANESRTGNLVN